MLCNSCGIFYEGKTKCCLNCVFTSKLGKNPPLEKESAAQNRAQRRLQIRKNLEAKEIAKKAAKIASYKVKCERCGASVQYGLMNAHYIEHHPAVSLLESTERDKCALRIQVFSGGLPGLGKRR